MKFRTLWLWLLVALILLLVVIFRFFCHNGEWTHGHHDTVLQKSWLNWNFVFDSNTTQQQRDSLVAKIRVDVNSVSSASPATLADSTSAFYKYFLYSHLNKNLSGRSFRVKEARVEYCTCKDSLLWNLQADLETDGSGGSVHTQTPPNNPVNPAGGLIAANSTNDSILASPIAATLDNSKRFGFSSEVTFSQSVLIGVIDSGLDTAMWKPELRKVFEPFGPAGSRSLVRGNPDDFVDRTTERHGTSVTSIMLNESWRDQGRKILPRILALKALDDKGSGTIFEMTCAVAYAIRSHVKAINISAGYYGDSNTVLNVYLRASKNRNIPIIAAAGNLPGPHSGSKVCSAGVSDTQLSDSLLFFPACMSADAATCNVIAVTGLRKPDSTCFYQNYSSDYVTVGVVNQTAEPRCCAFHLSYLADSTDLEGSSFATPVVTGRVAKAVLSGMPVGSVDEVIHAISALPSPTLVGGSATQKSKTYIMN